MIKFMTMKTGRTTTAGTYDPLVDGARGSGLSWVRVDEVTCKGYVERCWLQGFNGQKRTGGSNREYYAWIQISHYPRSNHDFLPFHQFHWNILKMFEIISNYKILSFRRHNWSQVTSVVCLLACPPKRQWLTLQVQALHQGGDGIL